MLNNLVKASHKPTDEQQGFLPDFRLNKTVFLLVLMAELLALVLTLTVSQSEDAFWLNLAQLSFLIQWIALGTAAVLTCFRGWIIQLTVPWATLAAFGLAQLVTLIFSLLALWVLDSHHFQLNLSLLLTPFVLRNLAISSIVCLMALRYFYIHYQWQSNVKAEANARLQALQARIRPHFLFNSLNTIASLIMTRPDHAEEAILDLSELFRATLEPKGTISLREELALSRRYLDIEHLRLGKRLRVIWQLDEHLPVDLPIPALILQPLVENAVYHGIQTLTCGGTIQISARATHTSVELSVTNPLARLSQLPARTGQRMAQTNVQQRLRLAYGPESRFKIQQTPESYRVTLTIPKDGEGNHASIDRR